MNQEHWRRVEDLFDAALERAPEVRTMFLLETCGEDSNLRREVEQLLLQHEQAGRFLEQSEDTATLTAAEPLLGREFGSYRILSRLGAGGMGEVYRAHDTKLDRDVAIKTLPPEFAGSPTRLARLRREARTLAALNHPNIGAIYGLEESNGVDCLVLELVEGETLGSPLPITEALLVAEQIAKALEVAHEKGIVHRDLKPANIKVTPGGQVKVLDFGLAKAVWGPNRDQALVMTGAAEAGTLAGHVIGTPGYMSPEQARGEQVDTRTDIWAFGCVLYELLSGKRAFEGTTIADTIRTVFDGELDWRALPPKTPVHIRELLKACLEKDAAHRLKSISEAKTVIEHARRPLSRWGWAAVALLVLAIGAGALAWRAGTHSSTPPAPVITRLTADAGLTAYPALSADGKLLAYASDRGSGGNLDIWIQQTKGGIPIRLTKNDADDSEPNFSPDGARIVFRSEREGGGVYVVPAFGGIEQRIAPLGRNPRFSPDGKWIAYWVGDQSYYGARRIFIVPSTGGEHHEIQPDFFFATHPVWSPDSKHLLFRGVRDAAAARRGLFDWWEAAIADGREAVQTGAAALLQQSKLAAMERSQLQGGFGVDPSDWIGNTIYFSASSGSAGLSGSLWQVSLSSRYHAEGPVQRLTSGTENEVQPSAAGARIAFATLAQSENIWSLPIDPNTGEISSELERLTSSAAANVLPAPSADGKKIAFASNRTGNMHVWIENVDLGTEVQLTSTPSNELPWLISPDGSRVVYCVFENTGPRGGRGCFITSTDDGTVRSFCADCGAASIQDWTENGRKLLYKKGLTSDQQIFLRDVESGSEAVFLEHAKYSVTAARFSPDGRWISFQTVIEPATRRQIFVAPILDGIASSEREWIPITDGSGLDRNSVWSAGGNLLYFLSERDGFRCIWAQRLDKSTKRPSGAPFAVHHLHRARRSLMPAQEIARIGLSVARDKIVFSMAETSGNIWLASLE